MQHNDIYKFLDSLTESKKAELFTDAVIEIFTKADIAAREYKQSVEHPFVRSATAEFDSGRSFAYADALVILMGDESKEEKEDWATVFQRIKGGILPFVESESLPTQPAKYIPYQKCPLCDGKGEVAPNYSTSSIINTICPTCNGARIIPMHQINEP